MNEINEAAWLLDLCGRIVMTHGLDPALLVTGLGLTPSDAAAVIAGCACCPAVALSIKERLPLIANILVRIELKCTGESTAMRHALATPLASLGGAAPIDLIGEGIDTLCRIRRAVDEMARPTERWWRVGH